MVKLSEEVAEALKAAKGRPIAVDVPGFDHRFVVIDQAEYDAAMAELELQKNAALIREGIADVEAGRTSPLDEAMDRVRNVLLLRKADDALR
jgi:PHD/YefM family antitoxin component YafN of YafNO toxin-antitoxin module